MYNWFLAIHILGFVLWSAALVSCTLLLRAHEAAGDPGRQALGSIERKAGILMDIGAFVSITVGLYLALGFGVNAFTQGGWLHVKTLLVAGLVGIHIVTRIKIRKFRNGNISPLPGFVTPLTFVLIAVIIIFGRVKLLS